MTPILWRMPELDRRPGEAAMQTDVCTIYLHDKASQKLIFRATEG